MGYTESRREAFDRVNAAPKKISMVERTFASLAQSKNNNSSAEKHSELFGTVLGRAQTISEKIISSILSLLGIKSASRKQAEITVLKLGELLLGTDGKDINTNNFIATKIAERELDEYRDLSYMVVTHKLLVDDKELTLEFHIQKNAQSNMVDKAEGSNKKKDNIFEIISISRENGGSKIQGANEVKTFLRNLAGIYGSIQKTLPEIQEKIQLLDKAKKDVAVNNLKYFFTALFNEESFPKSKLKFIKDYLECKDPRTVWHQAGAEAKVDLDKVNSLRTYLEQKQSEYGDNVDIAKLKERLQEADVHKDNNFSTFSSYNPQGKAVTLLEDYFIANWKDKKNVGEINLLQWHTILKMMDNYCQDDNRLNNFTKLLKDANLNNSELTDLFTVFVPEGSVIERTEDNIYYIIANGMIGLKDRLDGRFPKKVS